MYTVEVLEITKPSQYMLRVVTTRPNSFRFSSGQFCMLGIDGLFRAYSMASSAYDDYLEFLSVRDTGEFTSRLENIRPGDVMELKPKVTGSLLPEYLTPKSTLLLLATGTGIAPFVSIAKDFMAYARFPKIRVFHSVRYASELLYEKMFNELAQIHDVKYVPTVTREEWERTGRFWDYLYEYLEGDLDSSKQGLMVCGSHDLNDQVRQTLKQENWREGNSGRMGDFVVERAFVD